jgi:type IV pilus assembly protein PilX
MSPVVLTANTCPNGIKQRGAALVVSLIILLVLTLLGVQGMQTAILEEKMAGNFRDKKLAFEAAEEALRYGETWLDRQSSMPVANATGSNGVYNFGAIDVTSNAFWAALPAPPATTPPMPASNLAGLGLAAAPQFVIEERSVKVSAGRRGVAEAGSISKGGAGGSTYAYRITARGVGGSSNAAVILQVDFDKVF